MMIDRFLGGLPDSFFSSIDKRLYWLDRHPTIANIVIPVISAVVGALICIIVI